VTDYPSRMAPSPRSGGRRPHGGALITAGDDFRRLVPTGRLCLFFRSALNVSSCPRNGWGGGHGGELRQFSPSYYTSILATPVRVARHCHRGRPDHGLSRWPPWWRAASRCSTSWLSIILPLFVGNAVARRAGLRSSAQVLLNATLMGLVLITSRFEINVHQSGDHRHLASIWPFMVLTPRSSRGHDRAVEDARLHWGGTPAQCSVMFRRVLVSQLALARNPGRHHHQPSSWL